MTSRVLCLGLVALAIGSTRAAAQVLDLPPRPYRGLFGGGPSPDPNRSRQDFEIHGNFLGGYEDNLVPAGGNIFATYPGGYTGFTDTTVRYAVGKLSRGLELSGSGFVNTYRNIGLGPSYGGNQTASAHSDWGRRTSVVVSERLAYTPFFSLRLFDAAPVAPVVGDSQPAGPPTQAANQSTALAPTGAWLTDVSGAIRHSFTRTTRMNAGYSFDQVKYVDYLGYNSVTQAAVLGFDKDLSRSWALRTSYRFSSSEFVQQNGPDWPLRTNTLEVGPSYSKHLSRTRQITFSAGTGAVQSHLVEVRSGLPVDQWFPSGYGTVRVDLWRSWNVAADYRRTVSALQGVRPEAFVGDAATVAVGGFVNRSVESVFTAGYSSGSNLPSPTLLELGTYQGYNGSAQVRFRVSRYLAMLANVSRYQYELNDAAAAGLRVPAHLDRNAIRIGVTWSLPIVGTYLDDPRATDGRD